MAFCKACGQDIGSAAFCSKCGANQGSAASPAANSGASAASSEGLAENVAGLLCYVVGWLTGLIFLLIDKRPFVKFHAVQSILLNIAFIVLYFAIGVLFGMLHFMHLGFLVLAAYPLVGILFLAVWIFVMYKAYQHEKFMLPIIGNIADGFANK